MKIVCINVYLVQVGLHPVLAEVITDASITGFGEAAIAYGHAAMAEVYNARVQPHICASPLTGREVAVVPR